MQHLKTLLLLLSAFSFLMAAPAAFAQEDRATDAPFVQDGEDTPQHHRGKHRGKWHDRKAKWQKMTPEERKARFDSLPPEKQERMKQRRENRQDRREKWENASPEQRQDMKERRQEHKQDRRANMRERWENASPDQRQRMKAHRQHRKQEFNPRQNGMPDMEAE